MKLEDIKPGMVVKNTETGKIGLPFTGNDYGMSYDEPELAWIIYQADDDNKDARAPPFLGTRPEKLEPYELQSGDILTEEHVKNVCKMGLGEKTCRYMSMSGASYSCLKVASNHNMAHMIEDRIREGTMNAQGNNCGGRYNPNVL